MDQPRSDEDQQLVARTQSGEAAAFDELVVKYSPRLYGLIYNMTSNHEDTNDLLQDVFSKAYRGDSRFSRQIVFLHLDPLDRGQYDPQLSQKTQPAV